MNIDPQLQPFVDGASQFPKADSVPVSTLRELVRQASSAFPTVGKPIGKIEDLTIEALGGPLRLRLYRPAGSIPAPIIVFFHGGGWVVGDLDTQDMICRGLCCHASSMVISVDYRLAPEHPFPAAAEDCWTATRWTAEHASEIGGIPDKIAVAGDSAGATLAAGVALRASGEGLGLCGQVLMYGSCNYPSAETQSMQEFRNAPFLSTGDIYYFWKQYLSKPDSEQDDPLASPARAKSHIGVAPAFILSAENDPLRDDVEGYGRILVAAGVPVMARRYLGMVHGFISWLGLIDGAQIAVDDMSAWLKSRFTAKESS